MSTRIVIADDHPIFRQGLVNVIARHPDFDIVAEADDGDHAWHLITSERPDIAILDIAMPGRSGLDIVAAAREGDLPTRFVILTMYDDEAYFNTALDRGAMGYLLKDSAVTDLVRCLERVAQGRHFVSPFIADYLVQRGARQSGLSQAHPGLGDLTPTERRVLREMADARTSAAVAEALGVSVRTVQNHRANIVRKLRLKGHGALLQFAVEHRDAL